MELGGERFADPFDAREVRDGTERPVRQTILHDAFREHRTYAGECVELLCRRDVDVDRSALDRRLERCSPGRGHCARVTFGALGALAVLRLPSPTAFRRDAACRVYRGELAVEGVDGRIRWTLHGANGAQYPHRCAEQHHSGEKEESLFFRGRRHGATIARVEESTPSMQRNADEIPAPNVSPVRRPHPRRSADSSPTPCPSCPASCGDS